MADIKVWDELSQFFNVHDDEIDPGAADNILIAWPPIMEFIGANVPKGRRILEYGCGTGGFAKKLASLGYSVVGMDPAAQMIEVAKKNLPGIPFLVGDAYAVAEGEKFDAITAVMVFQFESDIEGIFAKLVGHLNPGGSIVFGVFNPPWVAACAKKEVLFSQFDSESRIGKGRMDFGEGRVTDVFVRESGEYDAVFSKLGFSKLLEERPPFTQEFLEKYPMALPSDVPEFLVLGYKRL